MIVRVLLIFVWALVVVAGYLIIDQRVRSGARADAACAKKVAEQGGWQATRTLPLNTRLEATDLKWKQTGCTPRGAVVGRFTARTIPQGQSINVSDLRAAPEFVPVSGRVPYVVSLEGQTDVAQVLNADSVIDVWYDAKPLLREVRVAALTCGPKAPADCKLVLDVPVDDADRLARSDQKKLLVLIRRSRGCA